MNGKIVSNRLCFSVNRGNWRHRVLRLQRGRGAGIASFRWCVHGNKC